MVFTSGCAVNMFSTILLDLFILKFPSLSLTQTGLSILSSPSPPPRYRPQPAAYSFPQQLKNHLPQIWLRLHQTSTWHLIAALRCQISVLSERRPWLLPAPCQSSAPQRSLSVQGSAQSPTDSRRGCAEVEEVDREKDVITWNIE